MYNRETVENKYRSTASPESSRRRKIILTNSNLKEKKQGKQMRKQNRN
jgi:hypothetical protein